MPEPKSRMTIKETAYHQQPGADPIVVETIMSTDLTSQEQPFKRTLTVGEQWVSLKDIGCWLDACSMVFILNEEGRRLSRNPTEAERAETAAKVVLIRLDPEGHGRLKVPPTLSQRFSPEELLDVAICCQSGSARVTVNVFPA